MPQRATRPFVPHFKYRSRERERVCSCHFGGGGGGGGGGEALLGRDATLGLGCGGGGGGVRVSRFAGLVGNEDLTCVFGAMAGFAGRRKGGLGGIGGKCEVPGDGRSWFGWSWRNVLRLFLLRAAQPVCRAYHRAVELRKSSYMSNSHLQQNQYMSM